MRDDSSKDVGLTSGQVSRLTNVPLQTLIRWDRSGVLVANRPGRRSSRRAVRRYNEDGVAAALFARFAARMGFTGNLLARMIRLMQSADSETLRRWVLYSYSSNNIPGLISHDFGDVADPAANAGRHIEWLRERRWLVGEPADLWSIREALLGMARNLIAHKSPNLDSLREEE